MREQRTGTRSDHVVVVGSDFELLHTVVDDLGVVVTLVSATVTAAVKLNESDAEAITSFTVTITNATLGNVAMTLPATETVKLSAGSRYYYDCRVHLSAANPSYPNLIDYPLYGILEVVPATTTS